MSRGDLFAAAPGLDVAERLFATSRDQMYCVKNRLGQYVSVNRAFVLRSRMTSESAVLGRTAGELFPPVLAAGYERQDGAVLAGRSLRNKLEMITNADGSTGWYLTQKEPVYDADRQVVAIASVSVDLHQAATGDPRLSAVAQALETIQQRYREPLRIEALARSVDLPLSQFERRVRAVLQVSPRQLLTQTRVDAAARALRETSMSLQQIAVDCGFYDQAQFTRQFRAMTGMTPGKYRTTVKSE